MQCSEAELGAENGGTSIQHHLSPLDLFNPFPQSNAKPSGGKVVNPDPKKSFYTFRYVFLAGHFLAMPPVSS